MNYNPYKKDFKTIISKNSKSIRWYYGNNF